MPSSPSLSLTPLTAISPIDGRYAEKTAPLRAWFSEYALMRYRVQVEVRWFSFLAALPKVKELPRLGTKDAAFLNGLVENFGMPEARQIKTIEKRINHDVKAVEYFIKQKIATRSKLRGKTEFVHFGCTSEDINNLAYALILRDARDAYLLPLQASLIQAVADLSTRYATLPMLARTHGQPASPTTLGKEMAVFYHRLARQSEGVRAVVIRGKMNGAVGNFNAHQIAYPGIDWRLIAGRFVRSLGLTPNPCTTQIEDHDYLAELLHALIRFNTVMIDGCRDIWGYIAQGYFQQKSVAGEVGSSTMPHKVNPIDFENSEGNLGIANGLLETLAARLPISRWQRDLSDSTALRTIGTAIGHCTIAYQSFLRGTGKLEACPVRLNADLEMHWGVLAEAVQSVMRRHGLASPYERLKKITRGQNITKDDLERFIRTLDLPKTAKADLLALSPSCYTGDAAQQAQTLLRAAGATTARTRKVRRRATTSRQSD